METKLKTKEKGKRVLLTGGAGFIGYHLGEYLKGKGVEVTSLDNFSHSCGAYQTAIYGDVRYFQDVSKLVKDVDLVYHLAAQINVDKSIINPEETYDTNVKGTLNVLEACKLYKKPLIFASSSEIYGSGQTDKIAENHPLDAQSPYAASKLAGDRLCKAYQDTYGMDIKIVRNFNTFGPYQASGDFMTPRGGASYGAVIAIFVARVMKDLPPLIFGDGIQERDYMWIDDCVQAYDLISTIDVKKPVNFGTGKTVKVKDIAEMVIKLCGKKMKPEFINPRPGEVQRLCADVSFAKSLGFSPKVSFEEGLDRYVKWYAKECMR